MLTDAIVLAGIDPPVSEVKFPKLPGSAPVVLFTPEKVTLVIPVPSTEDGAGTQ
jgi:hypothetical protein